MSDPDIVDMFLNAIINSIFFFLENKKMVVVVAVVAFIIIIEQTTAICPLGTKGRVHRESHHKTRWMALS